MPIYMKYEGIKGTVKAKGEHNGWIELQSAQIGTHRQISSAAGGNQEAGKPAFSEIVITKNQDSSSPLLFQDSLSGKNKKITVDFVRIEKGKELIYLSIEIEGAMISSYSISGHGGDAAERPTESISLSFTKITYSSKPTVSDPKGNSDRTSWDSAIGGG